MRPLSARSLLVALLPLSLLMGTGRLADVRAQDRSVVSPSTPDARIEIERGRDIVQPPSLWYQEGTQSPDSLGLLRVPCCDAQHPDAITYPDAERQFPVNLQVATFVRDGQIAELPLSADVLRGDIPGRIIIRPPAEDHYDVAQPFGTEPHKQVPGEETIIDAKAWYDASLRNPLTGQEAPSNRFHTIREMRGQLQSTARGGESVYFVIVAGPEADAASSAALPVVAVRPAPETRLSLPDFQATITLQRRAPRTPTLEWVTTTALLMGPNRARLPGFDKPSYRATRIKGDAASTLRLWASPTTSYMISLFGSSQATLSSSGSHHNVPYGAALAARFGQRGAFALRAEVIYEDDPFQRQGFSAGDQRLRLLAGYDYETDQTRRQLSIGPTYFRDQPSLWETARLDARELGVTLDGLWHEQVRIGGFLPAQFETAAQVHQSWGYIQDAGNRNTMLVGRIALKPRTRLGNAQVAVGPALYLHYETNTYASLQGFSVFNAQAGLELTSRIRY